MGKINGANIKKTLYYLRRNGIKNTLTAVRERMKGGYTEAYTYTAPDAALLKRQRDTNPGFDELFSIVVPTFRTPEKYLREMIDSCLTQTYGNLELILADATDDDSVKKIVSTYSDKRIKYVSLGSNEGISVNTNMGLEHAKGSYIALLDHDDLLTPDALYSMAEVIGEGKRNNIEIAMVYSDEDKCDGEGKTYFDINRKEKFNPDLLFTNNYICHFLVMQSDLMRELGFRREYDGAQDYDLVLRATGKLMNTPEKVGYVDRVLYHWRCHSASTAENPKSKQYAYEAGLRALQNFADNQGWNCRAEHLKHLGFYRLVYKGDIFVDRPDVGAIGGRVIMSGRIVGGRYDEEGECYYEGIPKEFSGYMNRAVLHQDAAALDIRCIKLNHALIKQFETEMGIEYKEDIKTGLFDCSVLGESEDYGQINMKLAKWITMDMKMKMIYMPELEKTIV